MYNYRSASENYSGEINFRIMNFRHNLMLAERRLKIFLKLGTPLGMCTDFFCLSDFENVNNAFHSIFDYTHRMGAEKVLR